MSTIFCRLESSSSGQLWAKRQPGGVSAALLINHSPRPLKHVVDFAKLNLTAAAYTARDLWARQELGTFAGAMNLSVPAFDSSFVLLSPSAGEIEAS